MTLSNVRNWVSRGLAVGLAAVLLCGQSTASQKDDAGQTVRAAIDRVAPAVVRIRIIGNPGSADMAVSSRVTTGLAIAEDGWVLTSTFGLTGQAAGVFVEDMQGQRYAAKVVARDHVRKLALLKCDQGRFSVAEYVPQSWPPVGATAIAAGRLYPGSVPSISVGIVSAVNRIFGLAIQTDAKISPVNYGGPLLDLQGRVMGILVPLSPSDAAEAIDAGVEWYDSGIGFAIPIADAVKSASVLRNGQDRVRGNMGIGLSTRNPLATQFSITVVHPSSPAAEVGLQKGDVIAAVNGVAIERFGHLESFVKSSYVGDVLSLKILRDDKELQKEITLEAPLARPPRGYLGMVPGQELQGDQQQVLGVQIQVLPEGPLAQAGVPATAVVSAVNDQPIASRLELARQLATVFAGQELKLTWFASQTETEPQTATVQPIVRPNVLTELPETVTSVIAGEVPRKGWKQGEVALDDQGGRVWFYAPEKSATGDFGMVVLLSAGDTPAEIVLKQWQSICETHNLLLAVPVTTENTGLEREHRELILKAASTVGEGRSVLVRRSFLVTAAEQAEVCTELILQSRRRQFGAAVFIDAWPQIAGVSETLLTAAAPSVLLLNPENGSRQRQALRQLAVESLQKAGSWVIQLTDASSEAEASKMEALISEWAWNLSVR